jgi:hypothetical protein
MGKTAEIKINWCFDTDHDFCDPSYDVTYEGFEFNIKRGERGLAHNIFMETMMKKHDPAFDAILGFLSELSWLYQTKAELLAAWTRGAVGKGWVQPGWFKRILNVIDLTCYQQVATNKIQKLALGFYREGMTSNSVFYSFLSYYKVIMTSYPTKGKSSTWINSNIDKIRKRTDIVNRLLDQKVRNIGEYFYISGRCALAHCDFKKGKPVVDPNSFSDYMRIASEVPLIKELAELLITQILRVPTWGDALKQWKRAVRKA